MTRILMIDDSPFSRKMLRAQLEKAGYEVVEASDGLTGLEAFGLNKPDVVMLDLTMTGMHGFEVLEQLRELDSGVKVLVASADIQVTVRQLAADRGAVGFIQKPFQPQDVVRRIESALRGEDGW